VGVPTAYMEASSAMLKKVKNSHIPWAGF